MSTLRSRFIAVVSDLRDSFPHSNISNRCEALLSSATAPDRPVSRFAIHTRRGMVAPTWDAHIGVTDLRNTVALAHREGLLDNDDFIAFEECILDYKEELRGERVEDAFTILQKSLRREARRNHKGL